MTVSITIPEEKLDELIEKAVKKVRDKIVRELFQDILEILKEILHVLKDLSAAQKRTEERINELAEAQKKTEERINELAEAQKRTEVRINELAEAQKKTEEKLGSLVGEVAKLRGDIIEYKVISDLGRVLGRYGFVVYSAPYSLREIDCIIEKDNFLVLVQICKTCDMKDLEQVLMGARKYKETENIEPNALVIFSYTGEIHHEVLDEAKKKGIIVENNTRKLAKRLLALTKERKNTQ